MEGFQSSLMINKIYHPNEIKEALAEVRKYFRFAYSNKKEKYFNVPAAFDIETSSFFRSTGKDNEKVAIMYEWTFGIYGTVMIGRTWKEFEDMIHELSNILDLNDEKRLIVYVHNLSYEFQFIRKHFNWTKVFSIENRKPIYAITDFGIEFRCSYLLSGYSLAKLGDQLRVYKVKKMVGDLDYEKIRHSETPLTDKEIGYCVNDVKVVMAYIAEKIEQDGNIAKIPITKTGYVRQYCRNSCFYEEGKPHKKSTKRLKYKELMSSMILSADEYKQLKRAFQGGFTHANALFSGQPETDVTSFDFTSSYPTVMIAEQYPMCSSEMIEITSMKQFHKNLKLYCCLFDIEFIGLRAKVYYENYISQSHCWGIENPVVNNGRIVSADKISMTITEQDYMIISAFYDWDKMRVKNFRRYAKGYLPTDFVKAILTLYQNKTTLKGVEGKEVEYLNSKEMLNSCYGMAVTDIVRPEYVYDTDWEEPVEPESEEAINKYNTSKSRFLFYPWGVWVTAYARRNLFTGIYECGYDYVYSDTDSIKIINADKHIKYIDEYNSKIRQKLYKAMDYHGLNRELIEPETIKGKKKCLGVWDYDGNYSLFKTLGAKRYLVKYSNDERNPEGMRGKINLTVAGLSKQNCVPYLLKKYGEDGIFEAFNNELYIPADYTGKNTHTYIDDEREGEVTDYLGKTCHYDELSSVHLEKADYSLSLSKEYIDYILNVKTMKV